MNLTASDEDFLSLQICAPANSLGEVCRIELTLNYPRTAKFKRCSQDEQKSVYDNWFNHFALRYGNRIVSNRKVFEECKSGFIHVHYDIEFKTLKEYYPAGLVSDIVKTLLEPLPLRHSKFDMKNYNCEYRRYRCPSMVVQLRDIGDIPRAIQWDMYLSKNDQN